MARMQVRGYARLATLCLAVGLMGVLSGCQPAEDTATHDAATATQPTQQPPPAGDAVSGPPPAFDPMPAPDDNPMTKDKIALGMKLFFDESLSGDGSRSCYSCHMCENGLTDGLATAVGAYDKKLTRSSPSLWNIGYHSEFYWDGRSPSLEKQALAAWKGGNMGADPNAVVAVLSENPEYREQFQNVFGADATPETVVQAIAAFERSIYCGTTPWDQFMQGETDALSESAKRGWDVWREKAGCGSCHAGILFSDLRYHNVGIGMDAETPDIGRNKVTDNEADTGAFKTPTLRDVAKSAPYFHDGSVATLEEAVELMLAGGKPNPYLDVQNLQPVELTAEEKADLIAFLESLDCECSVPEWGM